MKYFLLISFVFLLACNGRQKQALAHITERRRDATGQLVLQYRFYTGEKWVEDSISIPNQPLPNDSVKLFFTPGNPAENHLELP